MPRRFAPRQHLTISQKVKLGGVFWTMFEPSLNKIQNDCTLRAQNQNARAGKKEGGLGEGIFARPRFSAAEFRANEVGAPPNSF